MLRPLLMLVLLAVPASAVEVSSEVEAASDFLYAETAARGELLDGHVAVSAGATAVSDWHQARAGAEASVDAEAERWSAGLGVGWAPRQMDRGWLWLEPRASTRLELTHATLEAELGARLRRADIGIGHATQTIDQAQLRAEARLTVSNWAVGVRGLLSFYDPDLARLGPHADASSLISVAGKPERWAVTLDGARRLPRRVRLEAALGAVGYADGRGIALTPRVGLRVGPFAGITPGASVECVVAVSGTDPPHPIGGFTLEYER